jgi:hypothetical protein
VKGATVSGERETGDGAIEGRALSQQKLVGGGDNFIAVERPGKDDDGE